MRARRLVVAGLLLGLCSWTCSTKQSPAPIIELHRTASASFEAPASRSVIFALVIGSDVRQGDPKTGRADSLHVIAVNTKTGAGTIVGIPRDSYVPIPGHGVDKINASLDAGGPERTVQTVELLSGLSMQYWATIDFSRFRELVDAVGGVDVNIPYAMHDSFSGANFEPGPKLLNGVDALAFARDRHSLPQGDFDRSFNQGRLLLAALSKLRKDTSSPLGIARYLTSFSSLVTSNVPVRELLDLAQVARHADPSKMTNIELPGHGGSAGAASIVVLEPGAKDIFNKIKSDGVL